MANDIKLLNEFKQDLLGFTSKLSNAVKNQPELFKAMVERYEKLFLGTYKQIAALKKQTGLAVKTTMSGVVQPSPVDSKVAGQLDKAIEKAQKNTQPEVQKNTQPSEPPKKKF